MTEDLLRFPARSGRQDQRPRVDSTQASGIPTNSTEYDLQTRRRPGHAAGASSCRFLGGDQRLRMFAGIGSCLPGALTGLRLLDRGVLPGASSFF